jgi:ferritin-like metal-binding protein YciE
MPLKSLNDLLEHELKDIYSAERQITRALPKLAKAATDPKLRAAFEKHLEETKGQIEQLDQVFEMIGAKPGRKVCLAMQGLVAEGEELLEKEAEKADPTTFDAALIASAQRVEHYEIAAYGTARTYAEHCGFKDAARILQRILDQESKTNEALTKLAESGINQQAEQAGSGASA